jgi:hypothetical protein
MIQAHRDVFSPTDRPFGNASANREYRPAELLQLPLLCPSASLPITDCRPRTPPLVT